ncbi:MAG TPA: tetratricopeptide repeat protein, partial [Longimicrobium sp.]|nr:tetratricopeptide repeat protein [Longimicrobium sp.]
MTSDINALLDRATVQVRSGTWDEAAATLHAAYMASWQAGNPALLLESVVRVGHCHRNAGRQELAEEMLGLAQTLGELHGRDDIIGRALNGLGVLAMARGNTDAAEQLYLRANEHGRRAEDQEIIGETEQNLGVIANMRGDVDEAQARYETALEYLDPVKSVRGRITSLNNLGLLLLSKGELDQAEVHLQAALRICREVGDVVREGAVHINHAELYLARGEMDRAREACDEGFEIFSRLNDEQRQAEALKFYGVIYRESGKLHLAEIHLQRAIQITRTTNVWLEAHTQREMARVLRLQGRNRQALEALNRSHALFTSLQARPDLADIDERVAELEVDFLSLVRFWGESIEAKDRYTLGHCARVADYACRIAERAGLTERDLVWFRMGAFLHDVGKTEVPEEILNKPGRLTDEERAIMER